MSHHPADIYRQGFRDGWERPDRIDIPDQHTYVGRTLAGFCGGLFGRESYGDKRIEAVGEDWIVAREVDTGAAVFGWAPGCSAVERLAEEFGDAADA